MITPAKSPSHRRVAVIAGASAVLASAMTPTTAAVLNEKPHLTKKRVSQARTHGEGGGAFSLERTITALLRP